MPQFWIDSVDFEIPILGQAPRLNILNTDLKVESSIRLAGNGATCPKGLDSGYTVAS